MTNLISSGSGQIKAILIPNKSRSMGSSNNNDNDQSFKMESVFTVKKKNVGLLGTNKMPEMSQGAKPKIQNAFVQDGVYKSTKQRTCVLGDNSV